ncbi:MAG TPA: helix-turn-helix domain-containing protein [Methanothrix sp.]|nr:helix-turn-helix domain-containing protein [Methanothrix sp.]
MMTDKDWLGLRAITLLVMVAVLLSSSSGAVENESSDSAGLVLDIYVDDAGKALVTGYAKSIGGLPFLNASEYQYDEDAQQLYAVTNALTMKNGDDWEIILPAVGVYAEYHVTFYLTENVQLSNITGTEGLDYLVSSSSESFVVEFHGYDVASPTATVQYRQSVVDAGADTEAAGIQPLQPLQSEESSLLPLILAAGSIIVIVIFYVFKLRRPARPASPPLETPAVSEEARAASGYREAGGGEVLVDQADLSSAAPAAPSAEGLPAAEPEEEAAGEAPISGEMAAVMETLTERERSVLEALIKHEGKMTQADIRYETGIPKSSLTGIIVSLERRNIVTKKEWGRTNVIELSERLSQGGR